MKKQLRWKNKIAIVAIALAFIQPNGAAFADTTAESVVATTSQSVSSTTTTDTSKEISPTLSSTSTANQTQATSTDSKESSTSTSNTAEEELVAPAAQRTTISTTFDANEKTSSSEPHSAFTMADYEKSSALELAQAIRDKRVTSVQLVHFAFEKIDALDDQIHAMITLRKDKALAEAASLEDTGQPFLGVPILMKGLGHTIAGGENTNGLAFMDGTISSSNGSFTKEFVKAGFIIIGQTNFPELGLKNITNSKLYGPTGSGINPAYQAGGSSGGSAAGVAAGYAPIASGSDAGGSIRIPASWNDIIGFKPSRGVTRGTSGSATNQTVHFAETKTMDDTQALFDMLLSKDLPSQTLDPTTTIAYTTASPVGTPVSSEAKKAVLQAVDFLQAQGFKTVEVAYPIDGVKLMQNYYTIGAGSVGVIDYLATSKLKRHVEINDVDWTTWALYQLSKDTTKEDITAAWTSVQQISEQMAAFHEQYPLFLTPTTASTAPLVNDTLMHEEDIEKIKTMESLSKEEKQQLVYDQWLPALTYSPYTQLANLTGEPAISLPTFISKDGLPLGIQFNAALNNDQLLLTVGKLFENQQQFHQPEKNESEDSSSTPLDTSETSDTTDTTDTTSVMSETHVSSDKKQITPSKTASSSTNSGSSNSTNTAKQKADKQPKKKADSLPQTNDTQEVGLSLFGGITVLFTFILLKQRKR